jgi:hypothetical protein
MARLTKREINQAASTLGKRSADVRRKLWGPEFNAKMKEFGKLGGRPKKESSEGK